LWKSSKDAEYEKFTKQNPSLDDYEQQLRKFGDLQKDINSVSSIHVIGALSLNTKHLKLHLGNECDNWKFKVSNICTNFRVDHDTE
jgi:dynein heavy chain